MRAGARTAAGNGAGLGRTFGRTGRCRIATAWTFFVTAAMLLSALFVSGVRADAPDVSTPPSEVPCTDGGVCTLDELIPTDFSNTEKGDSRSSASRATLLFFWGVGCAHCERAKPFVEQLGRDYDELDVEAIEVRRNPAGRARFMEIMRRLGVEAPGIPAFVLGEAYVIGFVEGATEERVRQVVQEALSQDSQSQGSVDREHLIHLPMFGAVDVRSMALPAFTVLVGLVDGINPCAIWVLVVLLGILTHIRSTRRLALVGGTFVVMSGVVYFLFMAGWLGVFRFVGLSQATTTGLGAIVLLMGLVNLKELVWFKRGFSLTIPDRVKPSLYRRMRTIANTASWPVALAGVLGLAFFVNLIELGCTIGLPAVYTRVLSLRSDLSTFESYAYLVLYNVAYVVPLLLVVIVYATTLHRLKLSERGAKVLKGVSGQGDRIKSRVNS